MRGAGIGHTLSCYNYGLKQAIASNQEYLPCPVQIGHGIKRDGDIERFLGLPDCSARRQHLNDSRSEYIDRVEYTYGKHGSDDDFTSTQDWFRARLPQPLKAPPYPLSSTQTNITISIRRGDAFSDRKLECGYYLKCLKLIVATKKITSPHISVFSDGDGNGNYIDQEGRPASLRKVFKDFHITSYIPPTSNKPNYEVGVTECTFRTMSTILNSDIFIGSISGFTTALSLYYNGLFVRPPCITTFARNSIDLPHK